MKNIILITLIIFSLIGCHGGTYKQHNPYSGITKITTGNIVKPDGGIHMFSNRVSGNLTYYDGLGYILNIQFRASHWCFADTIITIDQEYFTDDNPHRSVISGKNIFEQMSFNITKQYLEDHKETGIKFMLSPCGDRCKIEPKYIKEFLETVEKEE